MIKRILNFVSIYISETRNFVVTLFFLSFTFILWLYLRQNIWEAHQLYPSERVDIYLRDGAAFYTWQRMFFAFFYIWSMYFFTTSKKKIYPWLATLFFVAISLADTGLLYYHYTDYQIKYPDWMGSIESYHFKYLIESVLAILINFLILRLMTTPRIKEIRSAFS